MVTVYWRLRMTGAGETGVHAAGETRFVVDCKVKPVALVGHVKITFAPEVMMVSCEGLNGPNKRLNTVPFSEMPPYPAVP